MNKLTFDINNGQKMEITQLKHDGNVIFHDGTTVTSGDFVMLMNFYRYIKENDIQNDFINPYGKNKEV